MGRLHVREQEAVDLLYYLWKAYKAAPDDEFMVYIKDLKSQCDDGRATFTAEDLMVRAENKYEARLLDEENTWGKPTEDQEKIVAMTAEINSLKKARSNITAPKTAKQKAEKGKTQANKKAQPKKRRNKRRRQAKSGHGRTSLLRITMAKKATCSSRHSKARNITGASTITMGPECGPCTTPTIVRQTRRRRVLPPTPTSRHSTRWTVTRNENDYCTRTKFPFGSG